MHKNTVYTIVWAIAIIAVMLGGYWWQQSETLPVQTTSETENITSLNNNNVPGTQVIAVAGNTQTVTEKEKSVAAPVVKKNTTDTVSSSVKTETKSTEQKTAPPAITIAIPTNDEPPLLLKSIGVDIGYYDTNTGKAGDFLFTKQKLQFNRLFMGFGFVIPSDMSSSGKDKTNPQPTFIVPLGTQVRSLVDGVVVATPTLWSGDFSIQVTDNGKMEKWIYETEHIIEPKVKVGDKVTAGQIVGEVSNFNNGAPAGFGTVEIGILKGGNPPHHVCPFNYLDPSTKDETLAKIRALYRSWENFIGDTMLYDEKKEEVPGCLTLDPIEG